MDTRTAQYKLAVAAVAVIVIGLLEIAALFNGVNGVGLSTAVGSIAGIVGFVFGRWKRGKEY